MGIVERRQKRRPFLRHVSRLKSPLYPLLSISTHTHHPSFPATLLHFYLLTESQLDDLAHFYHQRTPSIYSLSYPVPIIGKWRSCSLEEKRRRFGRFVGLRGCESPSRTDEEQAQQQMVNQCVARIIRRGVEEEERDTLRRKGF
jgi:hypothetical protein